MAGRRESTGEPGEGARDDLHDACAGQFMNGLGPGTKPGWIEDMSRSCPGTPSQIVSHRPEPTVCVRSSSSMYVLHCLFVEWPNSQISFGSACTVPMRLDDAGEDLRLLLPNAPRDAGTRHLRSADRTLDPNRSECRRQVPQEASFDELISIFPKSRRRCH